MRYIRRLFISLAVSIPCLVVFTLLFKALLGFLSGICSLPLLNSLSSGDLLNGVGTFSAVIIAVVSYQHDIETKQEEERSRSEKAKPQVEVDSFEEDYGFIVSITNVGPRPIRQLLWRKSQSYLILSLEIPVVLITSVLSRVSRMKARLRAPITLFQRGPFAMG